MQYLLRIFLVIILWIATCGRCASGQECGQRKVNLASRIIKGHRSSPGEWPWHATISRGTRNESKIICGGSIIDKSTILTAAHCLYTAHGLISTKRLVVHVGRSELSIGDQHTSVYTPNKFVIHSEHRRDGVNDDIALIILGNEIELNDYVQPVCLCPAENDTEIVGRFGTVVGFGLNDNKTVSDYLMHVEMPVVDRWTCVESNRNVFGMQLTRNMLCAGERNRVGPCNGDSGGGLVFHTGIGWCVRGIVSFSTELNDTSICDPEQYVAYTDVAKYIDWIRNNTNAMYNIETIEEETLSILQMEPSHSMVRPGDSVEVDCRSSAGAGVPIRWEKSDGTPFPYNFRQEGNRLYIQNVREDDSGTYTCVCNTEEGLRYISDFQLEVQKNTTSDVSFPSTPRVEFTERGMTVKLQCNTDPNATSYHWTRDNGELPSDRDSRGSILTLPNVQASDAGKYICSVKHEDELVNDIIMLVVNNVIPFFPQSFLSYMKFEPFSNMHQQFYFEISFKPKKLNGLILHASQRSPKTDFIALSLRNGYVQFRCNFGSKQAMFQAEKPVQISKWHTVKVNRVRNNGYLFVDDQTPVSFSNTVGLYEVNLDDHLYIGDVPRFDQVPASAMKYKEGFVGCISRLRLNEREMQLHQDAVETVGIVPCMPCSEDPCENAGICMETQTAEGFSCLCRNGYTGWNCQYENDG